MTRVTGIDTADRNMDNKDKDDAQKAAISTLDGLIHNADGTTTDPTTMQVVNNELRVKRQSFAQGTPFDNTQQHDATMNNAASIDAIRNHDIEIQKMKDEWRYNNSGPTSMTAQITKPEEWGAKTDEATVAKMHEDTMKFAGYVDGNAKDAVAKQETSDEWRATGPKTAWGPGKAGWLN